MRSIGFAAVLFVVSALALTAGMGVEYQREKQVALEAATQQTIADLAHDILEMDKRTRQLAAANKVLQAHDEELKRHVQALEQFLSDVMSDPQAEPAKGNQL